MKTKESFKNTLSEISKNQPSQSFSKAENKIVSFFSRIFSYVTDNPLTNLFDWFLNAFTDGEESIYAIEYENENIDIFPKVFFIFFFWCVLGIILLILFFFLKLLFK